MNTVDYTSMDSRVYDEIVPGFRSYAALLSIVQHLRALDDLDPGDLCFAAKGRESVATAIVAQYSDGGSRHPFRELSSRPLRRSLLRICRPDG
jgi:hypothetical protein